MKKKQRKAWLSNACVSPTKFPKLVQYQHSETHAPASRIEANNDINSKWQAFEVQCFTLYSILKAVDITNIDFLNLMVGGIEMDVLKEFPFDKVSIKMFQIEFSQTRYPGGTEALKSFMTSKGFQLIETIGAQFLFAHNSILRASHKNTL